MCGGRGGGCWEYANGQMIYVYEKIAPKGVVYPAPGAIYMYMYMTMISKQEAYDMKHQGIEI